MAFGFDLPHGRTQDTRSQRRSAPRIDQASELNAHRVEPVFLRAEAKRADE
jgi:hypothetical protein